MLQNKNYSRNRFSSKLSNLNYLSTSNDNKNCYLSATNYTNRISELSNQKSKYSKNINILSSYKHLSSLSLFSRSNTNIFKQKHNNIVTTHKLNLNTNSKSYLVHRTKNKQSSFLLYDKIFNNSFKNAKHYKKHINNLENVLCCKKDNMYSNKINTLKENPQLSSFDLSISNYNMITKQKNNIQRKLFFIKSIVDYSYPLIINTKKKLSSNTHHLYLNSLTSIPFYNVVDSEMKQNESLKYKQLNDLIHICSLRKTNSN